MDTGIGWTVLVVFYILPLLHVCLSPAAGPWRASPGSACPFSPRTGWLFIVLLSGPVGWLLFVFRRRG
ncbi:MAG: hypothetical protein IT563_04900 [Alphaproteobacteria bacterium]|nr:hypothetical protein [Alphaproteobacteria bacterium]